MVVHHKNYTFISISRIISLAASVLIVAIGLGCGYATASMLVESTQAAALHSAEKTHKTNRSSTLGAQTTTASPQPSATPAPAPTASSAPGPSITPSSCGMSNYTRPATPDLPGAGVHVMIDDPMYYSVGTDRADELFSLVHQCGRRQPNASGYDASTSYNLAWSYGVVGAGNGICRLDDVRVGIRINMLLPSLEAGRPPAVQSLWNSANGKLISHEQQHVAIDSNAARSLYARLMSFTESCQTIDASARAMTNAHASSLRADNDALDHSTNHGQL